MMVDGPVTNRRAVLTSSRGTRLLYFRSCTRSGIALCAAILTAIAIACGGGPTAPSGPTLKVSSVSPASGSTGGGTTITVTGTEFGADAAVSVGGVPATQVTLLGSTSLTAVVSARPGAGPADVVVTSGGKTASLASGFTFVAPSGNNQAPVITGIRVTGTRANQPANFGDAGETLVLTPSVQDNETGADQLKYTWDGPGTFTQNGAATSWTIPSDFAPTPSQLTVTVRATETYIEAGVTQRNVSAPATVVLTVHNSQEEILRMGEDFLSLFSQSNVSTNDVLHNFSTTCDRGDGRAAEKRDVDDNRDKYTEDFNAYRLQRRGPASFAFDSHVCILPDGRVQRNVDACSSFAVHFEDIKKSTGARGSNDGVDYVSAVLENNQWRLCHSDYISTGRFPSVQGAVP